MNNSTDHYREVGSKCAIARRNGDEATARFHFDWYRKAIKLEPITEQPIVAAAFDQGYKGEQRSTPVYFR